MSQRSEQPGVPPDRAAGAEQSSPACGFAGGPPGAPSATPRAGAGRGPAVLAVTIAVLSAVTIGAYYLYYPATMAPQQPIPFSHRFHVSEKQLSCVFCHTGAVHTEHAGVPPVQTCMLCHSRIIITYPPIETLREHYDQKRPIEWVKVNDLPDYVYFNHEVHVQKGFDCGRCHGDVAHMDRVTPAYDLLMGFCVQCHRDNGGSHDCLTCHR